MADYIQEEPESYHISYRPKDSGLNPVVPGVVSDKKRLDGIKRRATAGILRGLSEESIADLMRPRLRR